MRRRRYIAVAGTALLSGCGGLGASSDRPTTETSDTDTPAQTPEPTPTPEPAPTVPTHDIGESFSVVGDGDATPEYTVTDVGTTDEIEGDIGKTDADGEFVVVSLTVSNQVNGAITVSSSQFRLRDGQGRSFDVDEDTIASLSDSIAYETVDADEELSGRVIFDVPTDQDRRYLEVAPVGLFSGAEAHRVVLSS
jgi:hypothetical protein